MNTNTTPAPATRRRAVTIAALSALTALTVSALAGCSTEGSPAPATRTAGTGISQQAEHGSTGSGTEIRQDKDCAPLDAAEAADYVRDFAYTVNGRGSKSIGLFVEQAIALPAEFTGLNQVVNTDGNDPDDGGLRSRALVQLADGKHVAVRYDTSTKTGADGAKPNGVGGEEVSVPVSADGTVGTTSRTPLAGDAHTVLPTWTGANAVQASAGYVTVLSTLPGMTDFDGRDVSFDRPLQILSMVPGPDGAEVFFLPALASLTTGSRPQLAPTLYRGTLYDYTAASKAAAKNSGGRSITEQAARTACGR